MIQHDAGIHSALSVLLFHALTAISQEVRTDSVSPSPGIIIKYLENTVQSIHAIVRHVFIHCLML